MKNKFTVIGIILLIAVVGIIIFTTKGNLLNPAVTGGNVYCSDGKLADAMPIQSHRSYCVKSYANGRNYSVNNPNEYSFSVIDNQGNTLKDFKITHTKVMHVIVARKDLANFQHIHPDFNKITGVFTLRDLTFSQDGLYRIFADFAPMGGQKDKKGMPLPVTLSEDISVGNIVNYSPQPIGSEEKNKVFDNYQVGLSISKPLVNAEESMLTFNITQNGNPITDLQEYLGALGHSVILREGTLDFIHAHPLEDSNKLQNGKVSFMVSFPVEGKYKVFTQFQKERKVFTTDFVVSVEENMNQNQVPTHSTH